MLGVALGGNWPKVKPFVNDVRGPVSRAATAFLKSTAFKETFKEEVRIGGDPAHGTAKTCPGAPDI
jgi:hypothetical protein